MPSSSPEQRLYILDCDLSHWSSRQGRIVSCRTDGTDQQVLVKDLHELPDGIAIDHDRGHLYWTNMGTAGFTTNDGSIQRCDLATGDNITTILPPGTTFTPKQLVLAPQSQKLYWCDRADKSRWCVGIAVDERNGVFYWTQKGPSKGGVGRIYRAPLDGTTTEDPAARGDVECLFDGLPEPIDLELDVERQLLYWTDRGDPPTGNTLNRAYVGPLEAGKQQRERQILAIRFHETIGLALDERNQVAYVTDLSGGVYRVKLEGDEGKKEVLIPELGDVTGIALGGH
ncbi:3-hydroxyacyl-CoA dehydrogenase-like protein LAM1 [Lasiodiplodia hormozganensis]|uniref:3-hydroxyacyl-CoA dehydrogenase-like protein LAM1 n=1 Tax=Lasiodiplodia hormozganensis TaxID=869390 RepID=A0AA39Z4X7_9PEZI|nr:3-hydroxyacyl-CoA dehydrogenase-like protein LAM1 [Lasiodiplodia hormozganensis]